MLKLILFSTLFSNLILAALVGTKASDFTLMNEEGQKVSLSYYSNKIIVLEWLNHGCPFIKKHYNEDLITFGKEYIIWR